MTSDLRPPPRRSLWCPQIRNHFFPCSRSHCDFQTCWSKSQTGCETAERWRASKRILIRHGVVTEHSQQVDRQTGCTLFNFVQSCEEKVRRLFFLRYLVIDHITDAPPSRVNITQLYINVCVSQEAFHHFFREMSGLFASWKKHLNQNYSISAALSQLRISNLVDKPAFLIYLQDDVNTFKHSSLFYWEKLKAECASNHPVNSKQRAWRRDQIVIVRHLFFHSKIHQS